MGAAIARALAQEGARVVISDINDEAVAGTVSEFKEQGFQAMGVTMDVSNRQSVSDAIDKVTAEFGPLQVLVNNAGGALHTPHILGEIEEKHWDLVVNVNLKGTFFTCQKAIPIMVENGGGAIVNISALAAHYRASLAGVQYTAAKAGVEGLTRQFAYDWGPKGIRVNAVAPTVTMTGDRVRGLWEGKGEEEQERILANIPLRRLSEPREIAAAVVFLASDEASYVTGITLDVVGGRYLR
jgi:NAD(P)-dependent dehydrogenase (short-subunit alcohol dehydrogenase family)